jgi:hypothetical protein
MSTMSSTPDHAIPLRSARDRLIDLLGYRRHLPADRPARRRRATQGLVRGHRQHRDRKRASGRQLPVVRSTRERRSETRSSATAPTPRPGSKRRRSWKTSPIASGRANIGAAGSTPPAQSPHLLDDRAPVKVGIDTSLGISILAAQVLDGRLADPKPSDPRIAPYGSGVEVQVDKTQEGSSCIR